MTGISNLNFTAQNQQTVSDNKKQNKEIVYVSKNPDAVVNATGVVAGTSGMIGGAVVGGVAGAVRIPRELGKIAFNSDYGKNLGDTFKNLKNGVVNSAEVTELLNAFRGVNAPVAAESIINIAATLRTRLYDAFIYDDAAKAVIDKTIDPIVYSLTPRNNKRSYLGGLCRKFMDPATVNKLEFYAQQPGVKGTIAKLLGFNKSTSRIIGDVVGNFGQGLSQAVLNIKNFTPEERAAWGRVSDKMFEEFEKNPSLKKFKDIAVAAKNMTRNTEWISQPWKAFNDAIHGNIDGIKNMIKTLDKKVIKAIALKTVIPGSVIGAVTCGALSTLGWFGLKKGLMSKENEKTVKPGKA